MFSDFIKEALKNPVSSHIAFFPNHAERREAFKQAVDQVKDEGFEYYVEYMSYSLRSVGRIYVASLPCKNELMKYAGIRPATIYISDRFDAHMHNFLTEYMSTRMERRSK